MSAGGKVLEVPRRKTISSHSKPGIDSDNEGIDNERKDEKPEETSGQDEFECWTEEQLEAGIEDLFRTISSIYIADDDEPHLEVPDAPDIQEPGRQSLLLAPAVQAPGPSNEPQENQPTPFTRGKKRSRPALQLKTKTLFYCAKCDRRFDSTKIQGFRESGRGKRQVQGSPDNGPRVTNGEAADISEFPYLAFLISDKNLTHCGATFITESRLFTACRCLMKNPLKKTTERELQDPGKIEVIAGATNIDKGTSRIAKDLLVHPKCAPDPPFIVYDFGVLQVREPFPSTKGSIEPYPFLEGDFVLTTHAILHPEKLDCWAVGWGAEKDTASSNLSLKKIKMSMMTLDWCEKSVQERTKGMSPEVKFSRDLHTCSIGTEKHQTICAGDIGGPLLCGGSRKAVIGILSGMFSGKCGDDKNPAGWARFDVGFEWVLNAFEPPTPPTTEEPDEDITTLTTAHHQSLAYRLTHSLLKLFPMLSTIQFVLQ
ncbi:hypothetical protein GE061_003710 [Apolygus lucorum]|uniref:Peptidase S1 domain-containing protein n=1 Tax=Apolygus lucorum TaxID=248454 RepID=A0A8S9X2T5_APOLU|nr:hypothetical protein GE061_003710 [Apolygus lucorum]